MFSAQDIAELRRLKQPADEPATIPTQDPADPSQDRSLPSPFADANSVTLGNKLRGLRVQRKLTLREVGARIGLSVSFLSAVERSLAGISIANLQRLVAVYETNIASLIDDITPVEVKLVHPQERRVLETPGDGVRIENLVSGHTIMEPQLFTLAPGKESGGTYRHEGEEFIFVLQGTVEIWLEKLERFVITAGDCLYFKSTLAHEWKNTGQTNAILLWVNTPPTF